MKTLTALILTLIIALAGAARGINFATSSPAVEIAWADAPDTDPEEDDSSARPGTRA